MSDESYNEALKKAVRVVNESKSMGKDDMIIYLIEVNYKSGKSRKFWAKEFTFNMTPSGLTNVKWLPAFVDDSLYMNVGEIESVWQLDSKVVKKKTLEELAL